MGQSCPFGSALSCSVVRRSQCDFLVEGSDSSVTLLYHPAARRAGGAEHRQQTPFDYRFLVTCNCSASCVNAMYQKLASRMQSTAAVHQSWPVAKTSLSVSFTYSGTKSWPASCWTRWRCKAWTKSFRRSGDWRRRRWAREQRR